MSKHTGSARSDTQYLYIVQRHKECPSFFRSLTGEDITDQEKQMSIWVKYFYKLYSAKCWSLAMLSEA